MSAFQWCSGSIASVTALHLTRCTVTIETLSVTRSSMNVLMARLPRVYLGVSSARSLPVRPCPHRHALTSGTAPRRPELLNGFREMLPDAAETGPYP